MVRVRYTEKDCPLSVCCKACWDGRCPQTHSPSQPRASRRLTVKLTTHPEVGTESSECFSGHNELQTSSPSIVRCRRRRSRRLFPFDRINGVLLQPMCRAGDRGYGCQRTLPQNFPSACAGGERPCAPLDQT